jgi:hypothetical protein
MNRFAVKFFITMLIIFLLGGCVFVPNSKLEESDCKMYTPEWELTVTELSHYNMCNGSGKEAGACLVTVGIVIPLGSIIVSGSVIVIGNTIHWIEYQGHCDEGLVKRSLSKLTNKASSNQ